MSALAVRPTELRADDRDAAVPFSRLVRVEIRKMLDTRSGLWLLVAIGVITALVVLLTFINAHTAERTFFTFTAATGTPQGVLLPVLGVLLMTSEWSQRTAMTTFALVPRRGRVIGAKMVAALLLGLAALVLAVALGALAASVGGAAHPFAGVGLNDVGRFVLMQVLGVFFGIGFGLLLLNSAAAIVAYFALPFAFGLLHGVWRSADPVWKWIDPNSTQQPLVSPDAMTGAQWAHLAVSTALWVLLPLALGWWRALRAEVK